MLAFLKAALSTNTQKVDEKLALAQDLLMATLQLKENTAPMKNRLIWYPTTHLNPSEPMGLEVTLFQSGVEYQDLSA